MQMDWLDRSLEGVEVVHRESTTLLSGAMARAKVADFCIFVRTGNQLSKHACGTKMLMLTCGESTCSYIAM